MKDESEQKQVNELKEYLDEKITEHQRVLSGQAERRAASCAIKFGTSTTKVLTSATVLARIFLCEEWKMVKSQKKKDLIEKMIVNYGFTNDIQASKLPELKQMAEQYLLERERNWLKHTKRNLTKLLFHCCLQLQPSLLAHQIWKRKTKKRLRKLILMN